LFATFLSVILAGDLLLSSAAQPGRARFQPCQKPRVEDATSLPKAGVQGKAAKSFATRALHFATQSVNLVLQSGADLMTNLNRALTDIRNIRRQVAQTTEFHGYGPATLSATAVIAMLAGAAQSRWVPEPATHPMQYVALWLGTGIFCAALIATQMLTRANRLHSGMADEMIRMAVAQFLPAGIVGAILPFVLLHVTHTVFWMLPGLWQIIFSLGVFASRRCLPRPMLLVGAWFLLTGFACLTLGDTRALTPSTMSYAFAVGMALVAVIHYFSSKKASTDED
jgi:hypothetical protein